MHSRTVTTLGKQFANAAEQVLRAHARIDELVIDSAVLALDGLFETFLTILDEFGAFPAAIDREIE